MAVDRCGGNVDLTVKAVMAPELKIDQSVAHNGVCLTVVAVESCYVLLKHPLRKKVQKTPFFFAKIQIYHLNA